MIDGYVTAQQAKETVETAIKEREFRNNKRVREYVQKQIREAIESNAYLAIAYDMTAVVLNELKELGYTVEVRKPNHNGFAGVSAKTEYAISWNKA